MSQASSGSPQVNKIGEDSSSKNKKRKNNMRWKIEIILKMQTKNLAVKKDKNEPGLECLNGLTGQKTIRMKLICKRIPELIVLILRLNVDLDLDCPPSAQDTQNINSKILSSN